MVIFANLKDEMCHLSVVLICFSLILSEAENLFICLKAIYISFSVS